MSRDSQADSSRTGFDRPGREAFMTEINTKPMTIAEEAEMDAAAGRITPGVRGWQDYEAFEDRADEAGEGA